MSGYWRIGGAASAAAAVPSNLAPPPWGASPSAVSSGRLAPPRSSPSASFGYALPVEKLSGFAAPPYDIPDNSSAFLTACTNTLTARALSGGTAAHHIDCFHTGIMSEE